MKKFLIGGTALFVLSATAAWAADMPMKAPVYKAAAPFSWEGFYVGAHAGYGGGSYDHVEGDFVGSPTAHFDPKGWFGGVQIGKNSLIAPNWLLGSEVDLSGGDINGSGLNTASVRISDRIDFLGSARVRFGYVIDRTLVYATGGAAWAHAKGSAVGPLGSSFSAENYVGWAAGGGIEYAFDPRWSVKLEYIYSDLGHHREATFFAGGSPPNTADLKLSTVKLGLNYRLGDNAPSRTIGMPVKAAPAPRSWWDGSYVGLYAGYGSDQFASVQTVGFAVVPPSASTNLRVKGWLGGFQTGYNWQFAPTWVFGLETDAAFTSWRATGNETAPGGFIFPTNLKLEGFSTVRARLGYALDRTLLYATGGLAYVHQREVVTTGIGTGSIGNDIHDIGWTVGGGLEYAIDRKWSAKIEYLYADLGGQSTTTNAPAADRTSLKVQTVRVGLNYKFEWSDLFGRH